MLTQKECAFQLIDSLATRCLTAAASVAGKSQRIQSAVELLKGGAVTYLAEEQRYLVRSSDGQRQYTVTPESCECADHPPESVRCKHIYAVLTYQRVLAQLQKLQTAGVPHEHQFLCQHDTGHMQCWQAQCQEPTSVYCPTCQAGGARLDAEKWRMDTEADAKEDMTPQIGSDVHWSGPDGCHPDCPVCTAEHKAAGEQAPMSDAEAERQDRLARELAYKARLDAQLYEPYTPQPASVPQALTSMPEAPASLNIKLKLPGGGEAMYTLRSMQPGPAGDAELLSRLPGVLEQLKGHLAEAFPTPRQRDITDY